MTGYEEFLKWGGLGLTLVVIVVLVKPMVQGFIAELEASRVERKATREDFQHFIENETQHTRIALERMTGAVDRLCEGVGRLPCTEEVEPRKDKELAG